MMIIDKRDVEDIKTILKEENYEIIGKCNNTFNRVMPIDCATETDLSFCVRKEKLAENLIENTNSKVVITYPENKEICEVYKDKTFILVDDPRLIFARCMKFFIPIPKKGIDKETSIGKNFISGKDIFIGPNTTIGDDVEIGDNTQIYYGVQIYDNVKIGKNVIIHSGVVLGADGFSHLRNKEGKLEKFPQLGKVIIEDDVEIGANTCVDRATMKDTIIGKGTRIDNLTHIGHNVKIGNDCFIVAQVFFGGSVIVGDRCWIAPCVCIRDGIRIGNDVLIGMGAVVTKDVEDNDVVIGVPAKSIKKIEKIEE